MLEKWTLQYLGLREWVQWALLLPMSLLGGGIVLLFSQFLFSAMTNVREGSSTGLYASMIIVPFVYAVSGALNDVLICLLIPRGARYWLYFVVLLSVIAFGLSGVDVPALLSGAPNDGVTWGSVRREVGMSIGHLWLFFRYRHDVLSAIAQLRQRAEVQ